MKMPSVVMAIALFVPILATGCHDQKAAEIARLQAMNEEAKAEQARARAETDQVRDELYRTRLELARALAEIDRLHGRRPESIAMPEPEATVALDQQFMKLRANYDKSAITPNEWTSLKAKVIEQIPAKMSASERRTLGQRLLDFRACYDASAVTPNEWAAAKAKLIAQTPSPLAPAPNLDKELTDLKRAYDGNALSPNEWTDAKAQVAKWAK